MDVGQQGLHSLLERGLGGGLGWEAGLAGLHALAGAVASVLEHPLPGALAPVRRERAVRVARAGPGVALRDGAVLHRCDLDQLKQRGAGDADELAQTQDRGGPLAEADQLVGRGATDAQDRGGGRARRRPAGPARGLLHRHAAAGAGHEFLLRDGRGTTVRPRSDIARVRLERHTVTDSRVRREAVRVGAVRGRGPPGEPLHDERPDEFFVAHGHSIAPTAAGAGASSVERSAIRMAGHPQVTPGDRC